MATPRLTPDQIADALLVVQDALRQVGPYIVRHAGMQAHTSKQDGSPVTDADVEVEKMLLAAIAGRYPNVPVYGEETGYSADLPGTHWLIDPIDGTKSFIRNTPAFTSMAVLVQDNEAVAAAIYNPSSDAMYTAQLGRGTYKNGMRVNLGDVPMPSTALCKEVFFEGLNPILAPKGVVCQGSPAGGGYGFTAVIDGLAAARFTMLGGGYTHDYAPGALLVQEAGGVIIPIADDTYTYQTRSFVACHPELAATLRAAVPQLRALEQAQQVLR